MLYSVTIVGVISYSAYKKKNESCIRLQRQKTSWSCTCIRLRREEEGLVFGYVSGVSYSRRDVFGCSGSLASLEAWWLWVLVDDTHCQLLLILVVLWDIAFAFALACSNGVVTYSTLTLANAVSRTTAVSRSGWCHRPLTVKCTAQSLSLVDNSEKFLEASKKGNVIPLYRCIFSDHLTPVLPYRCLVKEDERDAPSFLFESVELDQFSSIGRYSVVGAQPCMEIVAKDNVVTVMDHVERHESEEIVEDPLMIPRRIMEKWRPQLINELPEAFCGGWVRYFSYDTMRYVEKKKLPFSNASVDDRNLPYIHLDLYDNVIVFDHVEKKMHNLSNNFIFSF